ncbi:MAG: S41 family peptidase [Myxococcota bacterium]
MIRILSVLFLSSLVLACGDDVPEAESFSDGQCAPTEAATFVGAVSRGFYLYPDQLQSLEPTENAPQFLNALIDGVDLAPDDPDVFAEDVYSFTTTIQRFEQSSSGNFVGIGIRTRLGGEVGGRFLRLVDVLGSGPLENPTPAGEAGLARGDRILAINGQTVESIIENRDPSVSESTAVNAAFGTGEAGEEVTLRFEKPDGTLLEPTLVRSPIEQTEVPFVEFITLESGERVGHMLYRSFTESSTEDLTGAVATLEAEGITKLIVDLRYNGGGLILVSNFFANLLAGDQLAGITFTQTVYNPEQSDREDNRQFQSPTCPDGFECGGPVTPLTGLTDIVFITTRSTASSSELLINGLAPHLNVTLVGSETFGKPVGFLPFEHDDCDQVYGPTTLKTVNSEGFGDYFGGLMITCSAEDDITRRFQDPEETSLAAAISFLEDGACPSSMLMSLRDPTPPSSDGWTYGDVLESLGWK